MIAWMLVACRAPVSPPGPVAPEPPDPVWEGAVVRTYPADLPPGPVCTVLAMHGRGDTPARFAGLFDGLPGPVQVVLPRAPDRIGPDAWQWFPPPAEGEPRPAEPMASGADALIRALDRAPLARPLAGAPIATGFSQGGMLAFAIAARHPDRVRAAFPVGGELPPSLRPAPGGATTAVRAFHGQLDQVVPIGPTREAIDALRAAGWPAEIAEYPDVSHTVPGPMRADLHRSITEACASP